MKKITTGLDSLLSDTSKQKLITGNIAYLCHAASVNSNLEIGIIGLSKIFKNRLKKIFGPQHGLVGDVQDNMVETDHFTHSFFNLPVYSLYSETRIPTDKMLEGIDTFIIDLQDVGTRVYTYIATMTYTLKRCAALGIKVVILDRPNPVGGLIIEGNILEDEYRSFVGPLKIPQRHAMTMGEVAKFAVLENKLEIALEIIPMLGWERNMFFEDTNIAWINPSPNLSTKDSAIVFVGSVLFEGTNISEGRGTTRALEYIGHPKLDNYNLWKKLEDIFEKENLLGFILRPISFLPTFQKHQGEVCNGFQIHVTDKELFRPWIVTQVICRELYHELGSDFQWNKKAYEYEDKKLSIDLINGSQDIRLWIEENKDVQSLKKIESKNYDRFLDQRSQSLIY